MGDILQPWHLILIAVVAFLLFGARKLRGLGKGLGEGLQGFREGIRGITDPAPSAPTQQSTVSAAPQSTSTGSGKATYQCPNCKNVLTANAPNPDAAEDRGFCPECGNKFDKKSALV